jgi:hypothetical protein
VTDLRIPIFGPDPDIIIHPSSIIHIRQLDTHRIIVAGLNSHLCQYDLRFRKMDRTPQPQNSQVGRAIEIENPYPTRSIVQYPEYHNSANTRLGFDINIETGVVAACQEQFTGTHYESVQLFSLHSGQSLDSPLLSSKLFAPEEPDDCNINCVRFARDSDFKTKSLYVIKRNIQRYAWVPQADAD